MYNRIQNMSIYVHISFSFVKLFFSVTEIIIVMWKTLKIIK